MVRSPARAALNAAVLFLCLATAAAQKKPGVYVPETDAGAAPIEGVVTSTAGFVGMTARGPLRPRLVTSWHEFERVFGGPTGVESSYLPYAVQGFFINGGKRAYIARVVNNAAIAAYGDELADGLRVLASGPGSWGNRLRVTVARSANHTAQKPLFRLTVELYGTIEDAAKFDGPHGELPPAPMQSEMFDNLELDPASRSYLVNVVNTVSVLIRVESQAPTIDLPTERTVGGQNHSRHFVLTQGADGGAATREDFDGRKVALPDGTRFRTGLAGIEDIGEVSILCVPDAMRSNLAMNGAVRDQCEKLKDRFGILSFDRGQTDPAQLELGFNSSYTAIYTPWLRVYDETVMRWVLVPPTGHVAGIYARTDIQLGVHKAPANEVVRGIMTEDRGTEKPLERVYTKHDQDAMNPKGINLIRDFRPQGGGILVWGGRTMSRDPQWRYVNMRRLVVYIETSLNKGTQWVRFEPNDAKTRSRVVASVTSFLTRVWKSGGLMGSTEREAFFVRCDPTTMTQDDIDNGRLVCHIGFAPVRPAEFVIFRLTQQTGHKKAQDRPGDTK